MRKSSLIATSMLIASLVGASPAIAGVAATPTASAVTLDVRGTDNIFAAGLGAGASLPADEGTVPSYIAVTPGQTLVLSAAGNVQCCGSGRSTIDADGFAKNPFGAGSHITNPLHTKVGAYIDEVGAFALVGVFNGATPAGRTPFKVGADKTILVPPGVTRLYLGYADGYGFNGPAAAYSDNGGQLTVSVTPTP
jgi:hypothetical protein